MKIAIINCVSEKAPTPMEAKNLYKGISWNAKTKFVEATYDKWLILSAKYGIINPNDIIEPYDISFKSNPRYNPSNILVDTVSWSKLVLKQLQPFVNDELHFHVGMDYFKPINSIKNGIRIKQPKNHSLTHLYYTEALAMYNNNLNVCLQHIQQPTKSNPEPINEWYHPEHGKFKGTGYQLWTAFRHIIPHLDEACLRKVGKGKQSHHKDWKIKNGNTVI